MNKKSIFYKYPQLYIWGLSWIHGTNFAKRYQYMTSFAKKGDLVLEPACGPAILANFLPKGFLYSGFDTNEEFLSYALEKGLNVRLGNVLEPNCYYPADVVIACDILHHLKPDERKRFIKNCFSATKRVFIICEPGKKEKTGSGLIYSLKRRLAEWSEKDGTGDFKVEYFSTRDQLLDQIEHGFEVIPPSIKRETKDFGEDIITVFFKDIK